MLRVTCAIIEKKGKILCAQRGEEMNLPLKWELPGGKLEDEETLEECLQREIMEELGLEITILEKLPCNTSYDSNKGIVLIPFRSQIIDGELTLKEHKQIKWLYPEELIKLDWAEADIPIVKHYTKHYHGV